MIAFEKISIVGGRLWQRTTQSLALCEPASNLNGPFYVTLQLHQTSSNLCKKGRKANFISTILLHGMKQHCWPLYQNCRVKVRFLCGLCHHEDPGCEEFPQVTNMKDRAGKSARIPPNDRQDERSFNAYVIVPPLPRKTSRSSFCKSALMMMRMETCLLLLIPRGFSVTS